MLELIKQSISQPKSNNQIHAQLTIGVFVSIVILYFDC